MTRSSTIRSCLAAALVAASCAEGVASFSAAPSAAFTAHQTRISGGRASSRSRSTTTRRFLVPHDVLPTTPDQIDAAHQILQHHGAFLTSQLLADAASAAVADATDAAAATAAAADEGGLKGLWMSYLQIFKNTLVGVHATIDGPLRSVGFEQTWGVSIFVFTAMIRALLIPVSIQQSKNAEYTKALRPYITKIQEKFKDNEQAKNRAVGKLYEDTEQNPLAGCLTSLFQLPVFLGLYRGVRLLAMDGELQEPFLFLPSLEGPVSAPTYRGLDWLTQGWHAAAPGAVFPFEPANGWEMTLPFLVMPVVLVLLQSATMKVLSPAMDNENQSEEEREQFEKTQGILKFLPLMIGFFSLQVPAGLTIYWFTSNIFTLTQSLAVRTYFQANPPKIELPEYWDAALNEDEKSFDSMTPEERKAAVASGIRVGPTLQDLEDEAKFHYLVERQPLRSESEAWKRTAASSKSIPAELEEWVKSASAAASLSAQQHAAESEEEKKSGTPFYASSNATQPVEA